MFDSIVPPDGGNWGVVVGSQVDLIRRTMVAAARTGQRVIL